MKQKRTIEIWDYWIYAEEKMAYCLGLVDGTLYLAESFVETKRNKNGR